MQRKNSLDRPLSFRKAMSNCEVPSTRPDCTDATCPTFHQLNFVASKINEQKSQNLHELSFNGGITPQVKPDADDFRIKIQRNHSSDSTSSDVSLLSSKSVTSSFSSKFFWLAIIAVALFVASTFAYLFIKIKSLETIWKNNDYLTGFCVPCEDVILGPFEEDNQDLEILDKREVGGVAICCAKTANQTLILANLIIERNRQKHSAERVIQMESQNIVKQTVSIQMQTPEPVIAAHVLVGRQKNSVLADAPSPLKNLVTTDPISHVEGLHVTKDVITVKKSGLYFVYSQIYFSNVYGPGNSQNSSQTLYHYVYRFNIIYPNGGRELLMKSVRTRCWAKEKLFTDYTSYTAAAFMLNAGDKLYVMVSDINAVSRDYKTSFFGVIKMS